MSFEWQGTVFDRVSVDTLVPGNSRIQWEIDSTFRAPAPWVFQLQIAESDGATANWTNVGAPLVNTFITTDPTPRIFGKELNVFYRLQLTTADANTYTSPTANVMGDLDIRSQRYAHEIVRKELLRLQALRVGIAGYLLKAKRSGTPCPECLDPYTDEVTDSQCPICYGIHWEGGYYDPYPFVFSDITFVENNFQRDEAGPGMVNPQIGKGMFVAFPWLSTNDVWVNKTSDVRYRIQKIETRTGIRGVPVLSQAELRPIPYDNTIYKFPIVRDDP